MNGSEQVSKTAVLTDSASDIPRELEEKYKHDLSFRADPMLHSEEFKLVDPDTGDELK